MSELIEVIPHIRVINKHNGREISRFSTCPDGNPDNWERKHDGYSWGHTSRNGNYTTGMHRGAVKTIKEANEFALSYAEGRDCEVVLMEEDS